MKRNSFLQMAGMGLMSIPLLATPLGAAATDRGARKMKHPRYLQPGDTIGITCPAGFALEETIQPCKTILESWGYKVILGATVGKTDHTFGGTDAERAADFQYMMDDPKIQAILCATGGYGTVRIIDQLNFSHFRKYPKWIIGFSDITVLHSHLHQVVGVASIHAKMCGSFPKDWELADEVQKATILSIKDALEGRKVNYPAVTASANRLGMAEGKIIGGNLKILENLNGSASMIQTKGKILVLEDVGEPLYNIDRMFCNLLRSGKLDQLKGLIIGSFSNIKADNPAVPFGRDIYTIVQEKIGAFTYPVCFDFPVGHIKNNFALKMGMPHRLLVSNDKVELQEL
ncbi:S66 peptidase family protein [Sediminibacterium sp. TEGAF015]|uniref:S66 peptidase family protein n=1 Tax=Sediminibacterium sp. TEGAF015 TaxID=575378 RepID=UPI00220F765C|nr:LD-carboxypeptidase [Sediminibacterium sp. TEGAF015]BDQ12183.1 peptidase S66 [Sediminibacterium sp. TEGAF015]